MCITGKQIVEALENGVSQYPKLEGRFPQVSGITFGFDASKPSGKRVDYRFVRIQGEFLELEKVSTSNWWFLQAFHFSLFLRCPW